MAESDPVISRNELVKTWSQLGRRQFLSQISKMSIRDKGNFYRSLRVKLIKHFGEIDQVSYQYRRHGIFQAKGVGRGTTIRQVGSTRRRAKDWITPVLEPAVEDLVRSLVRDYAKETVKAVK